jgi:glutathione S-transferase
MLQLFYTRSCPFCVRVLSYLDEAGISYEAKEITSYVAPERRELVELGGKGQVPFLVDPERGVKMYESLDIIQYLRDHYATGS